MTTSLILLKITAAAVGEFFTGIPSAWVAVIGAALGGALLKITEKWLNTSKDRLEEKKDYRAEIKELQDRLDKVTDDYDSLRTKYYAAQDDLINVRAALIRNGISVDPLAVRQPENLIKTD